MTKLDDKLTNDEIREMISEGDKNGDGVINYQEFAKMVRSKEKEIDKLGADEKKKRSENIKQQKRLDA